MSGSCSQVYPLIPNLCPGCWGCEDGLVFENEDYDERCKTCQYPFTVVKWSPRVDEIRKTLMCNSCSMAGNYCQLCGDVCPPRKIKVKDPIVKPRKVTVINHKHKRIPREDFIGPMRDPSLYKVRISQNVIQLPTLDKEAPTKASRYTGYPYPV